MQRHPLIVIGAIGSIAIGVGANAATFSAVYTAIYQPLPFGSADRLVYVGRSSSDARPERLHWSYPRFRDIAEHTGGMFTHLAAAAERTVTLRGRDAAVRARAQLVTSDYFRLFGITPHLGRIWHAREDGSLHAVVLSHELWRSQFAADPAAIGRILHIDGRGFEVIGIAPAGFGGLDGQSRLWIPLGNAPYILQNDNALSDRVWAYAIIGALSPGVTREVAAAALGVIGRRLGMAGERLEVVSVRQAKIPPALRRGLPVLLAAVGLVMCAACLNAAILLFAMFEARRRELAVRASLGASAARIARQLAIETGVVALAGAAAGILTAVLARHVIWAARPAAVSGWYQGTFAQQAAALDWRVLGYALAVASSGVILVGLYPVVATWRRERGGAIRLFTGASLAQATRRNAGALGRLLGTAELAVAFVLTANALLLIHGFVRLQRDDFGFAGANVLMTEVSLPAWKYDQERAALLYDAIERAVEAIPGVRAASFALAPPLHDRPTTTAATVSGEMPDGAGGRGTLLGYQSVSAGYLDVVGIRVLDGRGVEPSDGAGGPSIALVNRAAADLYWPGRRVVGQMIAEALSVGIGGSWEPRQIVGVVANVQTGPPGSAIGPEIYVPISQDPPSAATLFVRTGIEPDGIAPLLRERIRALDADVALGDLTTLAQHQRDAMSLYRFSALLLTVFGAMTLGLAAIGVYAVNAHDVRVRHQEFAVRMALGASAKGVTWFVVRRALLLSAAAVACGIAGAVFLAQVLRSQLPAIAANLAGACALTAAVLGTIAGLAALVPAWRGSRVSPMHVLRSD